MRLVRFERGMKLGGMTAEPARSARWDGRSAATRAQKRGPWPNTLRCASSWTTTVSSAAGGASASRHENISRPVRDALPPARSGIPQVDARRPDRERGLVSIDGPVDRLGGSLARPGLEDPLHRTPIPGRDADHEASPPSAPARSTLEPAGGRLGMQDPNEMGLAAIRDDAAVAGPTAGTLLGPLPIEAGRGGAGSRLGARGGTPPPGAARRPPTSRVGPATGIETTSPCRGSIVIRRPAARAMVGRSR